MSSRDYNRALQQKTLGACQLLGLFSLMTDSMLSEAQLRHCQQGNDWGNRSRRVTGRIAPEEINLHDHLIVTKTGYYSMRMEGVI